MTDSDANRRILNLYSRARLDDRAINELLGLAKGIVADGVVNQKEAEFLQKWLVANTAVKDNPVIATLFKRINEMLEDNNLDDEEAQELFDTLHKFGGGDFELGEIQKATRLHFDDPPPSIDFQGRRFCFTGHLRLRFPKRLQADRGEPRRNRGLAYQSYGLPSRRDIRDRQLGAF